MSTSTRIHSAGEGSFAEFLGSLGHRRPIAPSHNIDVIVIGHTGQVGSALVERLSRRVDTSEGTGIVFREGINRTRHLVMGDRSADERARETGLLDDLGRRLRASARPSIVIDCTADPDLPRHYPEWLRAGIGVVTPNKDGFSGELSLYRSIQQGARHGRAPLGNSAAVGAGLPILSTLRRLRRAGARPTGLSAVVSGTLAQMFSCMGAGLPLSAAVEDARKRGFTEPDPFEDLSGHDVARKLTIMLREAGLEKVGVEREPVVDDAFADAARGRGDVIGLLEGRDPVWRQRLERARAAGETWTYLVQFGPELARVGPVRVAQDSPFARLAGSGNLARIQLADDPDTPLEVYGPGAGVAVTASAVLADLAEAR